MFLDFYGGGAAPSDPSILPPSGPGWGVRGAPGGLWGASTFHDATTSPYPSAWPGGMREAA